MNFLEQQLTDNTLIVFSSDNGPVLDDGYQDQSVTLNDEHMPAGHYRGGKYSLLDGEAHVPFIVKWPNKIKPAESNNLVSQLDLLASLANLVGESVAKTDSENHLDTLFGKAGNGRESLILQALDGKTALRQGSWVFIPAYWGPEVLEKENVETGACSCYQLYNLATDPGQKNSVAKQYPKKTKEFLVLYNKLRGY